MMMGAHIAHEPTAAIHSPAATPLSSCPTDRSDTGVLMAVLLLLLLQVRHQGANKGMVMEGVLKHLADPARSKKPVQGTRDHHHDDHNHGCCNRLLLLLPSSTFMCSAKPVLLLVSSPLKPAPWPLTPLSFRAPSRPPVPAPSPPQTRWTSSSVWATTARTRTCSRSSRSHRQRPSDGPRCCLPQPHKPPSPRTRTPAATSAPSGRLRPSPAPLSQLRLLQPLLLHLLLLLHQPSWTSWAAPPPPPRPAPPPYQPESRQYPPTEPQPGRIHATPSQVMVHIAGSRPS